MRDAEVLLIEMYNQLPRNERGGKGRRVCYLHAAVFEGPLYICSMFAYQVFVKFSSIPHAYSFYLQQWATIIYRPCLGFLVA